MLTNDRQIDRRILLQADALEEAGWHVTILAMPLDQGAVDRDPRVRRIGSETGAKRHADRLILAVYRRLRGLLPMNGRLMRQLKSLAWGFLIDPERFYLNLFLADGRALVADVIVAHDLPMLPVGRVLAAEFSARLVYDSHELYSEQEFSPRQKRRWAALERRHIHACDRVITVNPSIARELRARYELADVAVIHNAERVFPLQTRPWYLHDYFEIPREHRVLLFQGGLSAGRNLLALLEAMVFLEAETVHLVLLGDGQLGDALRRIIRHRKLNRVHLHPAVPQTDLLGITASADAGIIPYQAICLNNYYCTPNKLFEFITAELPILASNLPELRRVIEGNDIGLVTELGAPEQIASAISKFFINQRQLEIWRNNLKSVREKLSWQRESVQLKIIYEALL